jgi:hypothetical protein
MLDSALYLLLLQAQSDQMNYMTLSSIITTDDTLVHLHYSLMYFSKCRPYKNVIFQRCKVTVPVEHN